MFKKSKEKSMKKICLSLLTLILSQNFSSAMEDPKGRHEDAESRETALDDLPTELHAHIFSFLDPDEAARMQLNRHYRDVHKEFYKETDPKVLKVLQRLIPKIIDKSITLDASERLITLFQNTRTPFSNYIDSLTRNHILKLIQHNKITQGNIDTSYSNLNIRKILKEIYTPEYVFNQFGARNTPLQTIIKRFETYLNLTQNLFMDFYIHFLPINKNSFSLHYMDIAHLSPQIGKFTNLTSLYLMNNKLRILPKEIGNLKKLDVLSLTNNHLIILPATIGELKELRSLSLAENKLKTLPKEIGQLKNLHTLFLNDNPNLSLSKEIWKALLDLPKLKSINLSNTKVHLELRKKFLLDSTQKKAEFIELVNKHLDDLNDSEDPENYEEEPENYEDLQNNTAAPSSQKKSFFSRIWKRNDRT